MNAVVALALVLGACADTTYDFDPTTSGEDEGTREPRGKSSSQFLRGVYADLLGRTPETFEFTLRFDGQVAFRIPIDEEMQLTGVLEGLGDSLPLRNLVVKGLLHSTELTIPAKASVAEPRTYITDQFRRLLGREPNVYELEAFAGDWDKDPAVGPRTIIRAIMGSREYQSQ